MGGFHRSGPNHVPFYAGDSCDKLHRALLANGEPNAPIRSPGCLRVLGKIVRRILLTSLLGDAIHFTPPTIAGDNHQCILEDARQMLRFQRECVAQASWTAGVKPAADALKRTGASVATIPSPAISKRPRTDKSRRI